MAEPSTAAPMFAWVSYHRPGGSAQRLEVSVCPECAALVTDRLAHAAWHEDLIAAVDERVGEALHAQRRADCHG